MHGGRGEEVKDEGNEEKERKVDLITVHGGRRIQKCEL